MRSKANFRRSLLIAMLMLPGEAYAQAARLIADRPTCATCTIRLVRVATLGNNYGASEPGSQGAPTTLARDSRGQIYAAYGGGNQGLLFVHGADGRVMRTIGRPGDGPGEFRRISALTVTSGDTLHVFDQLARRRSVMSPEGTFVRSTPLPGNPIRVLLRPSDQLVMNSPIVSEASVGFPLHVVDKRGTVQRSFGTDNPVRRPDALVNERRELLALGEASFLALHQNAYRLEVWSYDGVLRRAFARSASWFIPWQGSTADVSPNAPPNPHPVGIARRSDTQVWVAIRVPDPNWKSDLKAVKSESGGTVYTSQRPQNFHDTMIELLDLEAGKVIARARTSGAMGRFLDANHLARYSVDDVGRWTVEIVRVELITENSESDSAS